MKGLTSYGDPVECGRCCEVKKVDAQDTSADPPRELSQLDKLHVSRVSNNLRFNGTSNIELVIYDVSLLSEGMPVALFLPLVSRVQTGYAQPRRYRFP